MAEIEKAAVKSNKQRLRDRYTANHPDKDWEAEGAGEDLAGMAADELDAYDRDKAARKDMDDKFNKLFNEDKRSSSVFIDWANGKDPIEAFVRKFGSDMVASLETPEGQAKFKEANDAWKQEQLDAETREAEFNKNLEKSVEVMSQFETENSLEDGAMDKIILSIYEMCDNAVKGIFTKEMLESAHKAGNYDSAVESARTEGEVAGRNAKIRSKLKQSQPDRTMPPTLNGANSVEPEKSMKRPDTGKLDMFGGIPVRRKK